MLGKLRLGRTLAVAGLVAIAASAVVVGGVSAQPAERRPGNAPSAKDCQKDGWEDLVNSTGNAFASEGDCVAYAAQGGTLFTPLDLCKHQLSEAGIAVHANARYVIGTEGNDNFSDSTRGAWTCSAASPVTTLSEAPVI